MSTLELGIIGNGTVAALVDPNASIQWLCLPRLDAEPVFNALLGGGGAFSIILADQVSAEQTYIQNSAVIETILTAADGSAVKVTDFAPRFMDRGRLFRPTSIVRRVTPLAGMPRITSEIAG
jgi:GH15 family glucan-1,4-alpha-glucosidase